MRFNKICPRCTSPLFDGDEILEDNERLCHEHCNMFQTDFPIIEDVNEDVEKISKYHEFTKKGLKSNTDSYHLFWDNLE